MLPYLRNKLKGHRYTTVIPLSLIAFEVGTIQVLLEIIIPAQFIYNTNGKEFVFLSETMSLGWALASIIAGAYQVDNLNSHWRILQRTFYSGLIYLVLTYITIGFRDENNLLITFFFGFCLLTQVVINVEKIALLYLYRVIQRVYSNRKNTIVIGNTYRGRQLSNYFLTHTYIPQIYLGFFDKKFEYIDDVLHNFYLGGLDQVKKFCLDNKVKEIYYALDQQGEYLRDLMTFADEHFIFLGIIPNVDGVDFNRRVDTVLFNDSRIPVITSRKVPLFLVLNWYVKRTFDFIFSAFVLIILTLTAFPLIAFAIKLTSPGPIFFKQLRPGKNNVLFWCYKFRTMQVNSDDQKQATKNDCRITKVGAFLRKTSLDELPQFYNVLKGEMSVVGPRPNLIVHLQEYPKEIKNYSLRHWVTPGITGFAQINGYRGETKETYLMQKRVEHDLHYIENWSLSLDLKIIGVTILNILSGEDKAY